jgi:flagellar L-ring protein FlgH
MNPRGRVSPIAVLVALTGVAGCQQAPSTPHNPIAQLDHLPGDEGTELPVTNGAIYQGNIQGGGGLELFRDHRVWQIGDIVTIEITQNATATKNVSQNIGRTESLSAGAATVFGIPMAVGKLSPQSSFSSANTLQGSGGTAQSDSFVTTVSAMVRRVRPNGDLVIAGNDEVKLVGGKEYIRIAGVIRPEDIQTGNIVTSTQMAEAHIEFSGDGETYLAPKMGIFQRLFLTVSTIWPGDWF